MNGNIMEYKGYSALIQYSAEDECLVGRVVGINDILVFHGDSIAEVRQNFHDVLDNYLAACEETQKTPEQPRSGRVLLRLPPELHAFVAQQSEITGKSLNQMVIDALKVTYLDDVPESTTAKIRRQQRRRVPSRMGK